MHLSTEKDPKQGSPLSVCTGRATEKDWPKRPSDRQLQEARKKDSEKVTSPSAEAVHVPAHLEPPGSSKAKQYTIFMLNSPWGRAATGKKRLRLYGQGCFGSVRLFVTL